MRLWASIRTSRPRFPFATFEVYGGSSKRMVPAGASSNVSEDEKPHRSVGRQHPDTHADRAAPGDPEREGSGSVPSDLDRLFRGPGVRDQSLRQPPQPPPPPRPP